MKRVTSWLTRAAAGALLTLTGGGVILWLLVAVPRYQASRVRFGGTEIPQRHAELINEYRRTMVQVIGGVFLVVGAVSGALFTRRQILVAHEGQLTDRFTKAITHLGDEKLTVRLGGIYALERIANDSAKDRRPIEETLSAFVRENATTENLVQVTTKGKTHPRLRTDLQAVLTVLGRRPLLRQLDGIDLSNIVAPWADLSYAHLDEAHFSNANLNHAFLNGAHLEGAWFPLGDLRKANLSDAHLEGALFLGSDLEGASLMGAHLNEAILQAANLQGANLKNSHLEGTNLEEANLTEANLANANFMGAYLKGADFTAAHLDERTNFKDAHLEGAVGLPPTIES